jgi:fructokinase
MLTDALAASGVASDLAVRNDRPTTLAFVRLVDGQARYAFYDEGTAGRSLSPADLPDLPDDVQAMFFGGISLVGEPCGESYEGLMQRAAPDRLMMLDPNIRPGFIRDEGRYRARLTRMIALADIVKLSDEDLHWLDGPGEVDALARGLLARGPKLVLVTLGAEGAWGFSGAHAVFSPARRVTVADTVGAGDTFNAGVLAALFRGGALTKPAVCALTSAQIRAALDLGIAAAAVTVSRPGANPPWARDLA